MPKNQKLADQFPGVEYEDVTREGQPVTRVVRIPNEVAVRCDLDFAGGGALVLRFDGSPTRETSATYSIPPSKPGGRILVRIDQPDPFESPTLAAVRARKAAEDEARKVIDANVAARDQARAEARAKADALAEAEAQVSELRGQLRAVAQDLEEAYDAACAKCSPTDHAFESYPLADGTPFLFCTKCGTTVLPGFRVGAHRCGT